MHWATPPKLERTLRDKEGDTGTNIYIIFLMHVVSVLQLNSSSVFFSVEEKCGTADEDFRWTRTENPLLQKFRNYEI